MGEGFFRDIKYLILTRLEISFSVNKLCQFMAFPTDLHWVAAKQVLRCLKGTTHLCLITCKSHNFELYALSNSDWARSIDDHKIIIGYCVSLKNLVSWQSTKQKIVLRNSTEIKYGAISLVALELV